MDAERKRQLKALGKAEVQRRSAELQANLAASNPAPIGSVEWAVGYKRGTKREHWLKKKLPVLHTDRLNRLFVVSPNISQGWVPTPAGYLLCLGCGSALPSVVPRGRFYWGSCKCGNIRWRCFIWWGGGNVADVSKVQTVKLLGKA